MSRGGQLFVCWERINSTGRVDVALQEAGGTG